MRISDLRPDTKTPITDLPEVLEKLHPERWQERDRWLTESLVYLTIVFWGFDDQEHVGGLIVNRELADPLLFIFGQLRQAKFPIERMDPTEFGNDDNASMEANNTACFSYRDVTGHPGQLSEHGKGRAVDLNPGINPYVNASKNVVLPSSARQYLDAATPPKGKITDKVIALFAACGFDYGGRWRDIQDNHHFELRADGERRNPDHYTPAPRK